MRKSKIKQRRENENQKKQPTRFIIKEQTRKEEKRVSSSLVFIFY
jgi:hypothetical protein